MKKNTNLNINKSIFWIIMKLNLIILIVFYTSGMLYANKSYGQNVLIHLKNTNLETVFNEIEKQTGYAIFYEKNISASTFNADFHNISLDKVLTNVLKPFNLSYLQKDKQIVIIEDKAYSEQKSPELVEEQNQGKTIRGTVKDRNNEPLIGASITVKGNTKTGTVTDIDGAFKLDIPDGDVTIIITYLGYETVETPVDKQVEFNIILREKESLLKEVVAVGYGTQVKQNLTGSVEVISPKSLKDRPATNTSQLLQGTVSGVNFTYNNYGAEPGAPLSLTIRGQGSPYVIIDGVVGNLNMINPNDIENISVLKDAAASAIYGARAPYGVVLITTKSGKNNQKIRVDFSANASFTKVINKPKLVDSYTFVRAMNEMHDNQGVARLFNQETVYRIIDYINDPTLPQTIPDPNNPNKWLEYQYANGNNDWIDIHYGAGMRNQENLSLSGGGDKISFFISAGHAYEKGPFRYGTDNYRRTNFNSRLDFNLTKWWTVSSNTRIVESVRKFPNGDNDGSYRTMIHHIIRSQPQDYLKSPNGYYSLRSRIPNMEAGVEHTTNRGLVQRLATEITPVKNWKINADYAIDFLYTDFDNTKPVVYLDNVDGTLYPLPSTLPSSITKSKAHTNYQSYNIYTSYEGRIKETHNFKVMIGLQHESNSYDKLQGAKKDLITPNVPSITTATGEQTSTDNMTHWSTLGYFARLNYDYKGKYLFETNVRYDGTSKFTKGNRWGAFPSFSAGWNVSRENFWESISNYVNSFKVRASWGRLGNQDVNAYQDLPLLSINSQLPWIINDNRPTYVTGPNLVNENLTWETSETANLGIDLGFFNNRLQVTADIYQRLTFNRLGPAEALPAVLGASMPQKNNAELRTRGWDLSLSWRDNPSKDFSYSVTAMLFDYKSVYAKYNNPTGILSSTYEGQESGTIWGYKTLGLIQTQEQADEINATGSQNFISAQTWRTGDVMYADLNGDDKIDKGKNTIDDHGDWTIIGNTTPRYQFGLTFTATWKGFDMKAFFQGTAKRDFWLDGNVFWGFRQWNQSSLFPHHMDYYRDAEGDLFSGLGVNTDAYFPRPYSNATTDAKNKQQQTRYLQDGSYIRLKNLQFGYTLPQSLLKKINIQDMRIYVSGENIWTKTSLSPGFDPETANMGELGNGKSMFTQAVYAVGLNVSF
ncbi:SusC/RagA family TonB-linked outer membrane protein [Dysgonomonas reticulitermitis]|nr:SusC/RagA family TonB-linked outer membrane protein [Bacteroidia bacterium]